MAAPLTKLLGHDQFVWSLEAAAAFQALKDAINHSPMLALPDFTIPFVVETDASGLGMGVVLSQGGHPIVFFSKQLCLKLLGFDYTIQYRTGKTNVVADALSRSMELSAGSLFILSMP